MKKKGDEVTNAEKSSSLKGNENDNDNSLKPAKSCDVTKSQEIFVSASDWTLGLPQVSRDELEGKKIINSIASSGAPCTINHDSDASRVMIEESTLEKQINSHSSVVVDVSNEVEIMQQSQSQRQWQHLIQLGCGSSGVDSRSKGKQPMGLGGFGSMFRFHAQNPRTYMQSNEDHGSLARRGNNTTSNNNLAARANLMESVSPSGCSQWFGKHVLKEKGDVLKYQVDKNVNSGYIARVSSSDAILNSSSRTGNHSFARVTAAGPAMSTNGISLRERLKSEQQNINKDGRMMIFRQIVMMVEVAHSQELVFQDLRPSYFKLFPSNEVKYVGSLVHRDRLKSILAQETSNSEHHVSRKRYSEQEQEQEQEPQSNKNQKLNDYMMFSGQNLQSHNSYGFMCDTVRNIDVNIQENDSGFDMSEHTNPNHEYGTWNKLRSPGASEICRQLSTCLNFQLQEKWWFQFEEKWWYTSPEELILRGSTSSNIYSLGILLFELFCRFESREIHSASMLNLRYRIFPPKFLLENSKEAEFCLRLLHPEPSSRPSARQVLESEFILDFLEISLEKQLQSSLDEQVVESELLLDFLKPSFEQKEKHAVKLMEEIACIEADIVEVEKRHLLKGNEFLTATHETSSNIIEYGFENKKPSGSEVLSKSSYTNIDETTSLRNNQIAKAYFSIRSQIQLPVIDSTTRSDQDFLKENEEMKQKVDDRLGRFFDGLCKYALYSKFELRTTVRDSSIINTSNVISSLSFDRDEDFFAVAGDSKKIYIFEFNAFLRNSVDIHYPLVEMPNKSKFTCVTWNNYIKNYLVSADYDGVVQLWDVNIGQGFPQFLEHEKRAWSVDFSPIDPTKFASGSDDCSVKLWSINEKKSVGTIKCLASVCSVQFSPQSAHLLAIGCADFRTYCFDLRNTRVPWCVLGGNEFGNAVSYVRFVDPVTLVTASTDNALRLWDLKKTSNDLRQLSKDACTLTFTGHVNEKHFVGLSVSNGYIACGSETNEVYAYYKSFPVPITKHVFGSVNPISGQETDNCNGNFVSTVCWRTKSNMVVAGNSTGSIKILQLV